MHPAALIFCLGALPLFGIGYLLIRRGSVTRRQGGDAYIRAKNYRALGQFCLAVGIIFLGLAQVTQVFRGNEAAPADSSNYFTRLESQIFAVVLPAGSEELEAGAPAKVEGSSRTNSAASAGDSNPPAVAVINPSPDSSNPANADKSPKSPLDQLNAFIAKNPRELGAYIARGNIHLSQNQFELAQKDYKKALELDETSSESKFNLAEIDFRQKNYDTAREGFVALQKNLYLGDLASYKIFLCDLLGGHDDRAAQELDAYNQKGDNASYYFANIASLLYHGKKDEAQGWLVSANRIYSPQKLFQYSFSLVQLGFLPQPEPPPSNQ